MLEGSRRAKGFRTSERGERSRRHGSWRERQRRASERRAQRELDGSGPECTCVVVRRATSACSGPAQRLAVIAAQAHDTSSVMSKWQAKGGHHSAEAKLNRLEQRLASLGKGKPSMGGGPPAMPPAAPGAAEQQRISAKGQQLKDSLKQRLEFRPQKKHLVQNGILLK